MWQERVRSVPPTRKITAGFQSLDPVGTARRAEMTPNPMRAPGSWGEPREQGIYTLIYIQNSVYMHYIEYSI